MSAQRNVVILNTINETHYFIMLRYHYTQKKSYCLFFHHHEAVIFPHLNWNVKMCSVKQYLHILSITNLKQIFG